MRDDVIRGRARVGSALLFAVLFALLVLGCGGGVQQSEPQRLLDGLGEARIRRPPAPNWGHFRLRRAALSSVVRSVQFASVAPAEGVSEERLSLLAREGTEYRFDVSLPAVPRLRFGLGFVPASDVSPEPTTRHRLRVSVEDPSGDAEKVQLLEMAWSDLVGRDWQDLELDLEAWRGRDVSLVFECDSLRERLGLIAFSAPEIVDGASSEPGYDVVLISLDTLRADHLGSYGYSRPTSPNLDALASRGYRFATTVSPAPWTRPAHRALFAGAYASSVHHQTPVLAEVLWDAGYRTAAFTGGGMMDYRQGFDRGFEEFRVTDWIRDVDSIGRWLDRARGRKRLLFLHTYEIHDPYIDTRFADELPGGRLRGSFDNQRWNQLNKVLSDEERAYIEALYDGDIAFTDQRIGDLISELEERRLLERTVVVVTSDHGEQFWEHGTWRHGQSLYDHQLLVPLLIYLPDSLRRSLGADVAAPGRTLFEQVRLIDVAPTLLDLLGLPAPQGGEGVSLLPLLRGEEWTEPPAFAERVNITSEARWSIRFDGHKLIHSVPNSGQTEPTQETFELFRLGEDPTESENLAATEREIFRELAQRLSRFERSAPVDLEAEAPEEMDEDLAERLRALGYL